MLIKKLKILIIVSFLFLLQTCNCETIEKYKVIKVIDGDTVYIDFNNDGFIQNNERVRINGIDAFEISVSNGLKYQMKKYNFTQEEVLGLGYLGKEFAKKVLLNKYVSAKYSALDKNDKYNRRLMSIYYDRDKNYEVEILKAGLSTVFSPSNNALNLKQYENINEIKRIAKSTKNLKLVIIDINNECHKIDCINVKKDFNKELIDISKNKNVMVAPCCINVNNVIK